MAYVAPKGNKFAQKYREDMPDSLIEYAKRRVDAGIYPTIDGWCVEQDVNPDTVYDWINPESPRYHERFRLAHAKMMAISRDDLVSGAMSERYNANFAKFIASACHGIREEQNINIGGAKGGQEPLTIDINIIGG